MAKIPDSAEKPVTQQHLDSPVPDSKSAARVSSSGVTLVPRPSDDPKDPLVCPTHNLSRSSSERDTRIGQFPRNPLPRLFGVLVHSSVPLRAWVTLWGILCKPKCTARMIRSHSHTRSVTPLLEALSKCCSTIPTINADAP